MTIRPYVRLPERASSPSMLGWERDLKLWWTGGYQDLSPYRLQGTPEYTGIDVSAGKLGIGYVTSEATFAGTAYFGNAPTAHWGSNPGSTGLTVAALVEWTGPDMGAGGQSGIVNKGVGGTKGWAFQLSAASAGNRQLNLVRFGVAECRSNFDIANDRPVLVGATVTPGASPVTKYYTDGDFRQTHGTTTAFIAASGGTNTHGKLLCIQSPTGPVAACEHHRTYGIWLWGRTFTDEEMAAFALAVNLGAGFVQRRTRPVYPHYTARRR